MATIFRATFLPSSMRDPAASRIYACSLRNSGPSSLSFCRCGHGSSSRICIHPRNRCRGPARKPIVTNTEVRFIRPLGLSAAPFVTTTARLSTGCRFSKLWSWASSRLAHRPQTMSEIYSHLHEELQMRLLLVRHGVQKSECRFWCRLRGNPPLISPLKWTEDGLNARTDPNGHVGCALSVWLRPIGCGVRDRPW